MSGGMLAVLALFVAVRLVFLPSGFGFPFDAVFVTAAAAVIVALTALVVAVILATLRKSFSLGSCLPALRHVCPPRAARRRRSACKARGFERRARSSKRYIRDASERSLTFRALVAAFDDTDGLVYLREIETCAAITAGDVMREEIRRSIAKALAR